MVIGVISTINHSYWVNPRHSDWAMASIANCECHYRRVPFGDRGDPANIPGPGGPWCLSRLTTFIDEAVYGEVVLERTIIWFVHDSNIFWGVYVVFLFMCYEYPWGHPAIPAVLRCADSRWARNLGTLPKFGASSWRTCRIHWSCVSYPLRGRLSMNRG